MIERIKAAMPPAFKRAIGGTLGGARMLVVRVCALNGVTASAYYFFVSRRFDREHLSVLKGRLAYKNSLRTLQETSPLLRRNIHRLEKGLIMRPRRNVFGESFILETVRCYRRASACKGYSVDELSWATDVLDEYFNVVEDTLGIRQARDEYGAARGGTRGTEQVGLNKRSPFQRSESPSVPVSYDELMQLVLRRRSVRWYTDQEVPSELVQKCVDAAAQAPSACNRQPFRFFVAHDRKQAAKIAECAGGTAGFAQQLPAIVVVIGDLSAYPGERDRHLIYIDSALASMQMMLAAETVGLSTCPINWPDVDRSERRLQRILQLPGHERVIMLIAIGYADPGSGVPYSQKKRVSDLTQESTRQ